MARRTQRAKRQRQQRGGAKTAPRAHSRLTHRNRGPLRPYESGLGNFASHVDRKLHQRENEHRFYRGLDLFVDDGHPFSYLDIVSGIITSTRDIDRFAVTRDTFAIHVATAVCQLLREQRMVFDPSEFAKFGLVLSNPALLDNLAYLSTEANSFGDPNEYIDVLGEYLDAFIGLHAAKGSDDMETFAHILAETIKGAILLARKVNLEQKPQNDNIDDLAAMFGTMKH